MCFFTGRNDLSLVLSTFWAANAWDHKEKNTRFALQTVTLGKPFSSLIRTRTTIFLCICISYIFLYVYLSINPNIRLVPIFPFQTFSTMISSIRSHTFQLLGSWIPWVRRRIHNDAVKYVSPQMYQGRRQKRMPRLRIKPGFVWKWG